MSHESTTPLSQAKAFLQENPTESIALSSRLHNVNANTLKSSIRRDSRRDPTARAKAHGGQNRVLSQAQEEAIFRYIRDMYFAGSGQTKAMVLGAINAIREMEGHPEPTPRLFRSWLSKNKQHIKTTRIKVIPRSRLMAQDGGNVSDWFFEHRTFILSLDIKTGDSWHFAGTGFQIGITRGEEILVPTQVKTIGNIQV